MSEKRSNTTNGDGIGGLPLRLLTYNIQAGTTTDKYRDYVTKSWRQVLPHDGRLGNLEAISKLAAEFDIVGLQEVDDGSIRSGFVNQTQFIAERAQFPFWSHQPNRRMGNFATTCNGLLSRLRPTAVEDHKLPGRIAGRGALAVRYGHGSDSLLVVIAHLALGKRSRKTQLDFLSELLDPFDNCIVMGDFNAQATTLEMSGFLESTGLQALNADLPTFPSWRPQRSIDHFFVSPGLVVNECSVLDATYSDHLPVALEITMPHGWDDWLSECHEQGSHNQQKTAEQSPQ